MDVNQKSKAINWRGRARTFQLGSVRHASFRSCSLERWSAVPDPRPFEKKKERKRTKARRRISFGNDNYVVLVKKNEVVLLAVQNIIFVLTHYTFLINRRINRRIVCFSNKIVDTLTRVISIH